MPGRPLAELLKEKQSSQKQNIPSQAPKSEDSWSNMINKVKADVMSSASTTSGVSKPKTATTVEKKPVPQITKWQDEYQPIFEKMYADKYDWAHFSTVARAVNGRYDKIDLKDQNFKNFVSTSKAVAEAARNYYNDPTENNKKSYEKLYDDSYKYRQALAKKYNSNNKSKFGYVFDRVNGTFKTAKQFDKDNNSPEVDFTFATSTAKVFDKNGELITEIENINIPVYYKNHQNEKAALENKSLRLLNPVHQSWNQFALNNLEKDVKHETKDLSFNLLKSELDFIAKTGTVGSTRKEDKEEARLILQKIKGLSYDDQLNYLKNNKDKILTMVNNMGYYGKLNAVKSYRDKITDINWFNASDYSGDTKQLFRNIQQGAKLDSYREDYNAFLKFDKNTREQVVKAMQNNWEENSDKFGYDVISKEINNRYLNALISTGKDGSFNVNSYSKFLANSNPSLFGTSRNLSKWEKSMSKRLQEELKTVYYGMSKAFKKTFDDKSVTTKISDSMAFPLKYASLDFSINKDGYFVGDTDKLKQQEVALPLYDLLKEGDDFTNSKAVLFSNSEIKSGLYAIQRSDIEERMNSSSMLKMKKQDGTITTNESDYENGKKTVKYDAVDNEKILKDFISKTKDPSDIKLTYLKNTNVKGFVSFVFENEEGVKMQMFVPEENLKGMPIYEQTKLTSTERMFRANGNKQVLAGEGSIKNVVLKVNDKQEYYLSYSKKINGNIVTFKPTLPGLYFGAQKLEDVINAAEQYVKILSSND